MRVTLGRKALWSRSSDALWTCPNHFPNFAVVGRHTIATGMCAALELWSRLRAAFGFAPNQSPNFADPEAQEDEESQEGNGEGDDDSGKDEERDICNV